MFLILLACSSPSTDTSAGDTSSADTASGDTGFHDTADSDGVSPTECDDGDPTNDIAAGWTGTLGPTGWAAGTASDYTWAANTYEVGTAFGDGCMFTVSTSVAPTVANGVFRWDGLTHATGSGNKPAPYTLTGSIIGDGMLIQALDAGGTAYANVTLCRDDAVSLESCD